MNVRHQQFINEYLECWNATEAYRRVYPESSDDAARAHGARLVANGNVAAAIKQRVKEKAMSADEVLLRLAEHGRGDIGDFMEMSAADIKKNKKTRLIQKLTVTKTRIKTAQAETESETIKIEMYSAQQALKLLGEAHGLFKTTEGNPDADQAEDWYNAADE